MDSTGQSYNNWVIMTYILGRGICVLQTQFLVFHCSQLDQLQEVVLRGLLMYGVGPHGSELRQHTPNIQELDISDTLVSSWLSVSEITGCLPKLKSLNVR